MAYLCLDVETFGTDPKDGKLLGVALCYVEKLDEPFYLSLQHYDYASSTWIVSEKYSEHVELLRNLVARNELVGHNYSYDKSWVDHALGVDSRWHACTRLMWHLSAAPRGPRPYGLKDAQVELLGHGKRGDEEIEEQVKARGGKPGKDIYLADRETIAKYAKLDASSTAELYNYLKGFFDRHDYWWMLADMVRYSWLLHECTTNGISLSKASVQAQVELLTHHRDAHAGAFLEAAMGHVGALESIWLEEKLAKYNNTPQGRAARDRFKEDPSKHERFNLGSTMDCSELFYRHLQLPVVAGTETDGGKPSAGLEEVGVCIRESGRQEELKDLYESYKESKGAEKLLSGYAKPWLEAIKQDRLHPRYNPCGTVSYRLSGFKPQMLNAPFDEKELMACLKCDEGWEGLHADFVSVEPAVTAHYSQDPSLLKVFREGLGDVYLDLALTLFPNDPELRAGYDPMAKVTSEVKDRFKAQRKVAKVIQLAVQYTGTKYTVHKNLSMQGIPSTLASADRLVKAYWAHFSKVSQMNEALFARYAKNGNMIRNVVGRIVRVPSPRYKDLPNRFIQSSAHDLLTYWVMIIHRMVREQGLRAKTVIIDLHDSSSWSCPKDEMSELRKIFIDSLRELNEKIRMTVSIKIEMKTFQTLAGLKNDE